jgi:WD40 repeat protein
LRIFHFFSNFYAFPALAGFDRKIFLWTVYEEECQNVAVMAGHRGAVTEMHFSTSGESIYSCSTDKFVSVWNTETGQRVRKMKGHQNFINSLGNARRGVETLVSGSDDNTIKLWDARKKFVCHTLQSDYQVTAVCLNDTAEQVISGGIDNEIKVWDIRKRSIDKFIPVINAYRQISAATVKRIFILGPSHHVRLRKCALTICKKYETPLYDLKIDTQIVAELDATKEFQWMDMKTDEDEHSIEMHLPYIAKVMEDFKDQFTIIPSECAFVII